MFIFLPRYLSAGIFCIKVPKPLILDSLDCIVPALLPLRPDLGSRPISYLSGSEPALCHDLGVSKEEIVIIVASSNKLNIDLIIECLSRSMPDN